MLKGYMIDVKWLWLEVQVWYFINVEVLVIFMLLIVVIINMCIGELEYYCVIVDNIDVLMEVICVLLMVYCMFFCYQGVCYVDGGVIDVILV